MGRALLFTNTSCRGSIRDLINRDDFIIGVDGGLDTLEQYNIQPNVALGDFDSVRKQNIFFTKDEVIKLEFPPEKDFTDTELAVDYSLKKQHNPIVIINDLQGRFDHAIALISSLREIVAQGKRGAILGDSQLMLIIDKKITFSLPINSEISLIPLSKEVSGVTTTGLHYPLTNGKLTSNRALGISNVVVESEITISFKKGELLLIINFVSFRSISQLLT